MCRMTESPAVTRDYELKWGFGLRTAMLVLRATAAHSCSIELSCGERRADAKDLVSLACFSAARGEKVTACVSGVDSEAALAALEELFSVGVGRERCLHRSCECAPVLVGMTGSAVEYSCANQHLWTEDRDAGAVDLT